MVTTDLEHKNHIIHHKPVMLNEILNNLNLKKGHTYVDATFGSGGYSKAILDKIDCKVFAIDRDPEVLNFIPEPNKNFNFILGDFGNIEQLLNQAEIKNINGGIVADLGVSSM